MLRIESVLPGRAMYGVPWLYASGDEPTNRSMHCGCRVDVASRLVMHANLLCQARPALRDALLAMPGRLHECRGDFHEISRNLSHSA